jgi:hypothetical protein
MVVLNRMLASVNDNEQHRADQYQGQVDVKATIVGSEDVGGTNFNKE